MKAARTLGIKRFTYTVELVDNMRRALIMDIAKRGGRGPHPFLCPLALPAQNSTSQSANADSSVVTEDRTRVIVKGSATFERVMSILETACRVFGQDEVEPVLIIGLDTYDDTMRCVRRLHAEGYKMLTRALFNAYTSTTMVANLNADTIKCLREHCSMHTILIKCLFIG